MSLIGIGESIWHLGSWVSIGVLHMPDRRGGNRVCFQYSGMERMLHLDDDT